MGTHELERGGELQNIIWHKFCTKGTQNAAHSGKVWTQKVNYCLWMQNIKVQNLYVDNKSHPLLFSFSPPSIFIIKRKSFHRVWNIISRVLPFSKSGDITHRLTKFQNSGTENLWENCHWKVISLSHTHIILSSNDSSVVLVMLTSEYSLHIGTGNYLPVLTEMDQQCDDLNAKIVWLWQHDMQLPVCQNN